MARLERLVVFVPGFGGSELADQSGRTVWGGSTATVGRRLLRPERLSIAENPHLVATGLLSVAASVPGFAALHPYDSLIGAFQQSFTNVRIDRGDAEQPDLSANFVAFAYDWRQPVEVIARRLAESVRARLAHLGERGDPPEVVVLAHSLGGLVARYWLGPLGGHQCCSHLVTFGTPHRGSPKALEVLTTGLRIGPMSLDRLTDVLTEFESMHLLVPRYPMIADGNRLLRPTDVDLGPLTAPIRRARSTHIDIESASNTPQRTVVIPVFGQGHSTTALAVLNPEGTLSFDRSAAAFDSAEWQGDATVPQVSAIPIEMSDDPTSRGLWRPSTARHSRLVDGSFAVSLLRGSSGQSLSAARQASASSALLGLRLPDTVLIGERLDVEVAVHGAAEHGDLLVSGRVVHLESGTIETLTFALADSVWRCAVVARNRGAIGVSVRAHSPTGEVVVSQVDETVIVIDPAEAP